MLCISFLGLFSRCPLQLTIHSLSRAGVAQLVRTLQTGRLGGLSVDFCLQVQGQVSVVSEGE